MKRIESPNNPLVRHIRRLAKPRKREPYFLLEGRRLVDAAVGSFVQVESIVVASSFEGTLPEGVPIVLLAERLFTSVSSLETPDGILAMATRPRPAELPESGLVVVCAQIQDPGNLGAVVRVAEAAGASALATLPGCADPFGPKAVRGSMGSVLRLPIVELDTLDPLNGFRLAALVPGDGIDYREADYGGATALILGSEGGGVPPAIRARAEIAIRIPMQGRVESLNVATAAALVLYEAARRMG